MGKALEVLDIIAMAPKPLRFTHILNELEQPRGTLHRNLSNLVEEGLVDVSATGSYSPGLRLLNLAAQAWSKNTLRSVADRHIHRLHEAAGETVHLGVLSGLEVIYLDKLESQQAVRMHSQVGNASPLYCTGIGKAILAILPEDDFAAKAAAFDYVKHTPTTLHTTALLTAEIDKIRCSGIAQDREEHEPGIRCVAAGFGGNETGVFAGLSITAPSFRTDEEKIARWETLVHGIARDIEKDLVPALGPRHGE
ncbi:MAG: IclR family transcriptional regulator [Rhizobiaceae bacterium]